jgi:hypothetical protein
MLLGTTLPPLPSPHSPIYSPPSLSSSSRSHAVATITVTDVNTRIEGRLYIIDLAGSERASDSKNHDKVKA